MGDRARRLNASNKMRKDQLQIERLTAATRNAKASLKASTNTKKASKENYAPQDEVNIDRGSLSPSKRSGGSLIGYGLLDVKSYR